MINQIIKLAITKLKDKDNCNEVQSYSFQFVDLNCSKQKRNKTNIVPVYM